MEMATATQIEGTFGPEFSESLSGLAPGQWLGPLESSYGWHLVRIDAATDSEAPAFEDVRAEVARDVAYERERHVRADLIERLKQNYEIKIEDASK